MSGFEPTAWDLLVETSPFSFILIAVAFLTHFGAAAAAVVAALRRSRKVRRIIMPLGAAAIVLNWLVACVGYGIMQHRVSAAAQFADPTMRAGVERMGGSLAGALLELASCTCAFPTLVLVALFIAGSVWSDPDESTAGHGAG